MKILKNFYVGANGHLPKTKSLGKRPSILWLLLALPLLAKFFAACEKGPVEKDPTDRTATVWVRGNSNVVFDESAAKDSLNQIQDLKKLYALADGWWHHHDEETARRVMAWLADKMREVETESHRVFGKNLIDGNGSVINPRAINPETQKYLESLGFKVQLYRDDDLCELERAAVCIGAQDSCAWTWYTRARLDSALTKPFELYHFYWADFNYDGVPRETFRDSVDRHIEVIELWRDFFGGTIPFYRNGENMDTLYTACKVYLDEIIPDMEEKRAALQQCEDENSSIHFPQMKSQSMGTSVYKDPKKKQEQYAATLPVRNTGNNAYVTRRGAMQYRNGR